MTLLDVFHSALVTLLMAAARAGVVPSSHRSIATIAAVPNGITIVRSAAVLMVHGLVENDQRTRILDEIVDSRSLNRKRGGRKLSSGWHRYSGHCRRGGELLLVVGELLLVVGGVAETRRLFQRHCCNVDLSENGLRERCHNC